MSIDRVVPVRAGRRDARSALYRLVPAVDPVRHLLRPVLRADAGALPQARLPEMAGRAAHHRLVAGDGRAAARRARPARRLQPDLRQPRRRDDRADLLLHGRARRGHRAPSSTRRWRKAAPTALKGEVYTGPYTDELEVEEPQPGEDVELVAGNRGTAALTGLMQGKRGLIMGLANDRSLAWGIARALGEQGAELAFSYQGEALEKRVRPLAERARLRPADRLRRRRTWRRSTRPSTS